MSELQKIADICPFDAIEIVDGKLRVSAACKMCKLCKDYEIEGLSFNVGDI